MKIEAIDDGQFPHNTMEIVLIPEGEADVVYLQRIYDLRHSCSFHAASWQWETPEQQRPLERVVNRIMFRLQDDSLFEPRELDQPAAKKSA